MREIKIPKTFQDTYKYNRRRELSRRKLHDISGMTWRDASEFLGVDIIGLFIYLSHARKAGLLRDVKIT